MITELPQRAELRASSSGCRNDWSWGLERWEGRDICYQPCSLRGSWRPQELCARSLPHALGSQRSHGVGLLSSQDVRGVDCEGSGRKMHFQRCFKGVFAPSSTAQTLEFAGCLGLFRPMVSMGYWERQAVRVKRLLTWKGEEEWNRGGIKTLLSTTWFKFKVVSAPRHAPAYQGFTLLLYHEGSLQLISDVQTWHAVLAAGRGCTWQEAEFSRPIVLSPEEEQTDKETPHRSNAAVTRAQLSCEHVGRKLWLNSGPSQMFMQWYDWMYFFFFPRRHKEVSGTAKKKY